MADENDKTEIKFLFKRRAGLTELKAMFDTQRKTVNLYAYADTDISRESSVSINVHKMKGNYKKRRKYNINKYSKKEIIFLINAKRKNTLHQYYSSLTLKTRNFQSRHLKKIRSLNTLCANTNIPYQKSFVVNNCCRTCDKPECANPFTIPSILEKVYRCQVANEDTCCCSCNSDAMFEVMKSLYDCYKKKNCENCRCILCGFGKEKKTVGVGEDEIDSLEGKSQEDKEKMLRNFAKNKKPLPVGKTQSDKDLIAKVRRDLGLPPEPKNSEERAKLKNAYKNGLVSPLEGKTPKEKGDTLQSLLKAGIPLPEGRTPSEKALIARLKATRKSSGVPSEKFKKAKTEGFITPLEGKTPEQKENILRGLAKLGIPLQEGTSPSEKKIIEKVRQEMGLPPTPKFSASRKRLKQAYANGIVTPLEGKTPEQKEKALQKMAKAGISLPEGRTPSEKVLIEKIKATAGKRPQQISSEKLKKAKAEGFVTPLKGKTPEQKEKLLRGLAKYGIPLPEATTDSEKKIIDKVRQEIGLPPTPKSSASRKKLDQAYANGIVTPLEGKTLEQKEKAILKMAEAGIPLPEGRTPSEKALIDKVKKTLAKIPSEKLRKAKAAGIITPLEGKTPEQKEKILRGLATHGIPLPDGKTQSEQKLVQKVRKDMGLPTTPKSSASRKKLNQAYADGIVTPLEGKTPEQKEKALQKMAEAGVPLPEGRTPSEKVLIEKIKATAGKRPQQISSEKLKKAKAEGFVTPLKGKTPEQKEKLLRGLAKYGIPLPEATTDSEKKIIDKVRQEVGLPPTPKSSASKKKLDQGYVNGIVTPLEGKNAEQKEKALRKMAEAGIQLPEGRTPSEKALIDRIKATATKRPTGIPSQKVIKAKAEGFITPLAGKTPEQKERILRGLAANGIPLPEGQTDSEITLIDKVRKDLGLPPKPKTSAEKAKLKHAYAQGLITPLEGKTPNQKENVLRKMKDAGIPLPEGRTPSEQALINKIRAEPSKRAPSGLLRKAKEAGLLTPLEGKTPEKKEKIIKGLAQLGLSLPEGKTPSDTQLIDKVRKEMGLPPAPRTPSEKIKMAKLYSKGLITPLEGKSPEEKEKLLRKLAEAGSLLPEGRTPSEKAMIDKIKAETKVKPSAGILASLDGKTPEEKEKILKGFAVQGIPLPQGRTPSEKELINQVRKNMGLPSEPKSSEEKWRLKKAYADGIVSPLEGKPPEQKEKILKKLAEAGVTLPEGRTLSERAVIAKVKAETARKSLGIPSEKIKKAKDEGLITPLVGKTPEQKEKILKGLAKNGIPLPEGKTDSEKKLIDMVRHKMGLPPTPKSSASRKRLKQGYANGIVTPLVGKNPEEKEKALRKIAEAGIPLPEGRTPSERALIEKIKATAAKRSTRVPSEKLKKAKAEGLMTPLKGKTTEQKEKILRGLAKYGIPLAEGTTDSEKKLIDKVRQEMGLPPTPKSSASKKKLNQGYTYGVITPLEGKTPEQKEKALQKMAEAGIPLPEGRTPSEKSLIKKIKATTLKKLTDIPSEKLKKAKAEGLMTPITGKTPEQKEKILRGLAKHGIPLPEGQTPSEKSLIAKVKKDMGLPLEPKTSSERKRWNKAYANGIITPLEGKSPEEKEKALLQMAEAGILLPEGRTPSEKALIDKIQAEVISKPSGVPTEKFRNTKEAGLITPLQGKTPQQKKKILQGLATNGIPFPEGKTASERKLMDGVRKEMGLPPLPQTPSKKALMDRAYADGIITPLEGKSPDQKEIALERMFLAGVPLPEGRTDSEKAMIEKVKAKRLSEIKMKQKDRGSGLKAKGISQKLEEITKATKCDRACGCDRKKIRFKHSYVKIRVTSPDISSFCDCPDECVPGVKGGVFVDNDGIKITVGFSSVASMLLNYQSRDDCTSVLDTKEFSPSHKLLSFCSAAFGSDTWTDVSLNKTNNFNSNKSLVSLSENSIKNIENKGKTLGVNYRYSLHDLRYSYLENTKLDDKIGSDYYSLYLISSNVTNNTDLLENSDKNNSCTSLDSVLLLKTDSSLSFSVGSHATELATISVISINSSLISAFYNSVPDLQTEIRNIVNNNCYSAESICSHSEVPIGSLFYNDDVTILRFTRNKRSKDKNNEKRVLINEPDSENIMKSVAKEILNQTKKSESSSVFLVVQSENYTNTDTSSAPSQSMSKNNSIQSVRESYPIVTSEHQLQVASRGAKLTSMPRDMTELVPVTKKNKCKKRFGLEKPIPKSDNKLESKKTRICSNNKTHINVSNKIAEDANENFAILSNIKSSHACHYHKTKISKISSKKNRATLEAKQHLGIGLTLGDQSRCMNRTKQTTPSSTHRYIETTRSLNSTSQKATEIVPERKSFALDTTCDRPCTCKINFEGKSTSSPVLSQIYKKSNTEFSGDAFIRNSISYLYPASQYVSPYSSTSDAEACKCIPKPEFTESIQKTKNTKDYNMPVSDIWIDYGQDEGNTFVPPELMLSSEPVPCRCSLNKRKFIEQRKCNAVSNALVAKARRNTYNNSNLENKIVDKVDCYKKPQEPNTKPLKYNRNASNHCCKRNEPLELPKMCNECCGRAKIVDCLSPGQPCDPCERVSSFLPTGLKLSNLKHSKNHLRDLLIYEDSSHTCCCNREDDDDTSNNADADILCKDYCSGETFEDIRDAVLRFMKARMQGVVCKSKTDDEPNICHQTQKLFLGMDEIIEQHEKCGAKPPNISCGNHYSPTEDNFAHSNNCKCPEPDFDVCGCNNKENVSVNRKSVLPTPITPFLDIHHIGLREKSRIRKCAEPKDPLTCVCRAPKSGKPPLEKCVCPRYERCECPSATDEQWMEYFSKRAAISKRQVIKLQTEMTHTFSGFKFMKSRKHCDEIETYEEALEFYSQHEGLSSKGNTIKANPDGTCPGCGDKNCPGLWDPNFFDSQNFDPNKLVEHNAEYVRYAKKNNQKCYSTCEDDECPGLGSIGLLPPIPGGPVSDVMVKDPAEKGPHRACGCEPKEDFENTVYCPPEGPVYCECAGAKNSSTSCECWPEGEGLSEESNEEKKAREETKYNLKVGEWDKGYCAPFGGIKVSLGGKGTASTGLKGICCFNAFESHSQTSLKSGSSEYVVYI